MQDLWNQEILHVKQNQIEYLQFKRLLQYPDIVTHAYTLKIHDIDFGNINTIQNKRQEILDNYKKIADAISIDIAHIVRPYQTHSTEIKCVKIQPKQFSIYEEEYTKVDGLLTNQKQVGLSLTYADCTAILLFDPTHKVIGNIHSGWKGTLHKIGEIAIQKMVEEYESNPSDILCCICPTIRQCHFEVEKDVKDMFEQAYRDWEKIDSIIQIGRQVQGIQKYNIDTVAINKKLLQDCGVKKENIIDSNICTVCHHEQLHSYRYDGITSGRNTAIIALK